MMKSLKTLFLICASVLLVACGGGGGGGTPISSGPVTSVDIFQTKTAYVNYVNDSRSLPFTIAGTTSGVSVTGSGTVTQSTLTSSTFEGLPVLKKVTTITGTVTGNGVSVPLATTATSYVDSNYTLKGSSGSEYLVVTNGGAIPATAKVNDTGILYSANRYTGSAKTTLLGTTNVTYVLQPETASAALLKLIQVDKNTAGSVTMTSTLNFRITPAGGLTRLSESSVGGTTSLTVTY